MFMGTLPFKVKNSVDICSCFVKQQFWSRECLFCFFNNPKASAELSFGGKFPDTS